MTTRYPTLRFAHAHNDYDLTVAGEYGRGFVRVSGVFT